MLAGAVVPVLAAGCLASSCRVDLQGAFMSDTDHMGLHSLTARSCYTEGGGPWAQTGCCALEAAPGLPEPQLLVVLGRKRKAGTQLQAALKDCGRCPIQQGPL